MENNPQVDYPNFYNMFQSDSPMYGRPSENGEISDIDKLNLPSKKVQFEDLFNDEERYSLNQIVPPEVTSFIKSEVADQIEAISETFSEDHDDFDDISKRYVMNQWSDISFKLDEDGLCKLKIKSASIAEAETETKNKRKPTKNLKTKKSRDKLSSIISPKNKKVISLKDPLAKLCVNNNEGYNIWTVVGNKTMEIKTENKNYEHHRPHQYSCKYQNCFCLFANLKDLQKHYIENHGGVIFGCTNCSFMTINQQALRQHQSCHHLPKLSRTNSPTQSKKLDGQSTNPQRSVLKNKFKFSVKFESREKSKGPAIKEMFSSHQFPNGGNTNVQLISLVPTKSQSMIALPSNIKLESSASTRNLPQTIRHISSPHPMAATPNVGTGTSSPIESALQIETAPRIKEELAVEAENFPPLHEVAQIDTFSMTEEIIPEESLAPVQEELVMDFESSSDVSTEVEMHNNKILPSLESLRESRRRNECKKGFATLKEIVPDLSQVPRVSRLTILKKANEYIHCLQKGNTQLRKEIMLEVQRNEKLRMLINQMNK